MQARRGSNCGRNLLVSFLLRDTPKEGWRLRNRWGRRPEAQGPCGKKAGGRLSVFPGTLPPKMIFGNRKMNLKTIPSSTTRWTFYHWNLETASDKKVVGKTVGKAAALNQKRSVFGQILYTLPDAF